MTREQLCGAVGSAPDSAPSRLLAAWEGRRAELGAALERGGQPKPVKLRLREELRGLDEADSAGLVSQLRLAAQADRYFDDFAAEAAKASPVRSVLRLCLEKARPIAEKIADEAIRYAIERKIAEFEERIPAPPIEHGRPPHPGASAESNNAAGRVILSEVPGRAPLAAESLVGFAQNGRPVPSAERAVRRSLSDAADLRGQNAPGQTRNGAAVGGQCAPGGANESAGPKVNGHSQKHEPVAASRLEMIPVNVAETLARREPVIRFFTGERFVVGRQSGAELVARHGPESEENRRKTSTISRVNTTLSLRGRQILVQDGEVAEDGAARPSKNGTVVDGQRISGPLALNFAKERRISMGQFGYEFRALLLPGHALCGPLTGDASCDQGAATQHATQCLPDRPLGCLRFTPPPDAESLPLWLFSEAALGSLPDSAVAFEPSLPPIAARIHHWRNGFWLEIPSGGKSVISLDGSPRSAGDVIPLGRAHDLHLGHRSFHLQTQ